ncbi:MAG: peptidoglycan recognition family protein [Myxococcota bacterium]
MSARAFTIFLTLSSLTILHSDSELEAKPPKMSAAQVRAHNARVLATLGEGLERKEYHWKYIVVHHTASEWSSFERIDRMHREKFDDPDGIQYHFLVGNGKKREAGYIERGRWGKQKLAIHLFRPEGAPDAIAISLVGNFHEREVPEAQMHALVELTRALAKRYDIPAERITSHTRVDGRLTVCPGKHFPFEAFLKRLAL